MNSNHELAHSGLSWLIIGSQLAQYIGNRVKEIDQQLDIIRNKGRQAFLETNPESFSKILHDYSDKKKGFIIWKDLLEEQIV